MLFSRCKYEIGPAIDTLEDSILEFRHGHCAPLNNLNVLCERTAGIASQPPVLLLNLPATLLPVTFTGQRLLGPELLSRLQVEGVSFDLLDNVFLLDFSLEATQGVF